MDTTTADAPSADALRARRARVAARLRSRVVVPAGLPSPRTYAAATYPFRAGSHFLYLTGVQVPGAHLVGEGEDWTMYVPTPPADDALWHGASPSTDDLAQAVGCPVRRLEDAPSLTGAATVPSIDAAGRADQAERLGRPLDPPTEDDLALQDALIATRLVQDDAAVAGLRHAAAITAEVHAAGMAATRVGGTEAQVRAAMEAVALAHDVPLAYVPIVTVHGEVLHAHAYANTLGGADLLLADVGAESPGGWASDVTRTWPVDGTFSPTQRALYDVVLASQAAAIDVVAPGVRYADVHTRACEVLAEGLVSLGILRGDPVEIVADGTHAAFMPHGVGHLIGLDVHDMEDLGDRAGYAPGRTRSDQLGRSYLRLDRDLVEGMAVTIEPGLYRIPALLAHPTAVAGLADRLERDVLDQFADWRGIRIEDDVLVTADGAEVLTDAIPRQPEDVEAAVGG